MFYPTEIAICGLMASDSSAFATKLIRRLVSHYNVGYVRQIVPNSKSSREGLNTERAWESGATQVYISGKSHPETLHFWEPGSVEAKIAVQECDILVSEGFDHGPVPKVVFLDNNGTYLKRVRDGSLQNIIAVAGPQEKEEFLAGQAPYFNVSRIDGLIEHLMTYFENAVRAIPLNGLVLTGGRSARMNSDKALLDYGRGSQASVVYDLIDDVCDRTFLSSRSGQWHGQSIDQLPQINDSFLGIGPVGGILSAMRAHPQVAWLVVACDLPFVSTETFKYLKENRNISKYATCFKSETSDLPEPLCSIYEPRMYLRLLEFMGLGYECPRKVLKNSPIVMIEQLSKGALDNINHPEEYSQALTKISQEIRYE